ncbi:MAG: Na+/H+ antiporter NhaA [Bacteroidia bacterium]|nr:Na+/H+ antiporter NhaA [Bacteroidia bacterium]
MRQEPIDRFLNSVSTLFQHPTATGILLTLMVLVALVWANSPWHESYHWLWSMELGIGFPGFYLRESLHTWINDGLMTVFFFSIGLEIKREMLEGELSTWRKALLPLAAAVGGMIVPMVIYSIFNFGTKGANGCFFLYPGGQFYEFGNCLVFSGDTLRRQFVGYTQSGVLFCGWNLGALDGHPALGGACYGSGGAGGFGHSALFQAG